MRPDAPRGVGLGINLSRAWRSASGVRADGNLGAYVEWNARNLVEFFDPTER